MSDEKDSRVPICIRYTLQILFICRKIITIISELSSTPLLQSTTKDNYSKTPIYRGFWGQAKTRGKSGSAVDRGFVWFTLWMFSPIWGEGNGRGISGFAVNRGAVYRGFTVITTGTN